MTVTTMSGFIAGAEETTDTTEKYMGSFYLNDMPMNKVSVITDIKKHEEFLDIKESCI